MSDLLPGEVAQRVTVWGDGRGPPMKPPTSGMQCPSAPGLGWPRRLETALGLSWSGGGLGSTFMGFPLGGPQIHPPLFSTLL